MVFVSHPNLCTMPALSRWIWGLACQTVDPRVDLSSAADCRHAGESAAPSQTYTSWFHHRNNAHAAQPYRSALDPWMPHKPSQRLTLGQHASGCKCLHSLRRRGAEFEEQAPVSFQVARGTRVNDMASMCMGPDRKDCHYVSLDFVVLATIVN